MTDDATFASDGVVLTIDGTEYPVRWSAATARIYGEMGILFGCDPDDLKDWIDNEAMTLPRVAYLAWLSRRLEGLEPDPAEFLDGITAGSTIHIGGLGPVVPSVESDADPEA